MHIQESCTSLTTCHKPETFRLFQLFVISANLDAVLHTWGWISIPLPTCLVSIRRGWGCKSHNWPTDFLQVIEVQQPLGTNLHYSGMERNFELSLKPHSHKAFFFFKMEFQTISLLYLIFLDCLLSPQTNTSFCRNDFFLYCACTCKQSQPKEIIWTGNWSRKQQLCFSSSAGVSLMLTGDGGWYIPYSRTCIIELLWP